MQFSNFHNSSEFQRITRRDFCENMDSFFERIDKENTAFVITEEDKDDLLICPAHWFDFQIDTDFNSIVVCAVRYAVGRGTYMPDVVDGFVRRYLKALQTKTLHVLRKDIKVYLDTSTLSQRDLWASLYSNLGEEILTRELPEKNPPPDGDPS